MVQLNLRIHFLYENPHKMRPSKAFMSITVSKIYFSETEKVLKI